MTTDGLIKGDRLIRCNLTQVRLKYRIPVSYYYASITIYTPFASPIEAGNMCQPVGYTRVLKSIVSSLSSFCFNIVYLRLFMLLRLTECETESEAIKCIVTCCGFQQSAHGGRTTPDHKFVFKRRFSCMWTKNKVKNPSIGTIRAS